MSEHERVEELLPLYVAGGLPPAECAKVEQHLAGCEACQADLDLWRAVGSGITAADRQIPAPAGLFERSLQRIHDPSPSKSPHRAFMLAFNLLHAQVYLVRMEMWPASAAVMAIGIVVTFLLGRVEIIRFIAPLVAAASLAAISGGPEHDPAFELTLATATSTWKVLLARLTLVSAYNLALALVASLFVLLLIPSDAPGMLILGWLGPMTFLSALALFLSLWIGTGNSIAVAYGLWMIQYPPFEAVNPASLSTWLPVLEAYRQFWHSPFLLLGLGALLVVVTLWTAERSNLRLTHRLA